jgi:hypothetical protein
MQLYLAKKNQLFDIIQPLIGWNGFVTVVQLKQTLNQAAELNVTLNRDDAEMLKLIMNNDDIAFRLIDEKSEIDIPFVKKIDGETDTESGSKLNLVSFISNIKNVKPYFSVNQNISGDSFALIESINKDIVFQNINAGITFNYNAGSKNNLEIIDEICKRNNWSYRENGYRFKYIINYTNNTTFIQFTPSVLVGDFKLLPVSRLITNNQSYSNENVILNEIRRKNKISTFKYNRIVGTLSGSGSNSNIVINNNIIADALYPIVQQSNGSGAFEFYIKDSAQVADDYDTISIQLWNGATAQDLYNLALVEILKRKNSFLYEIDVVSKTFIKAGEKIKIEYTSETLPLFFTATVVESQYDFGSGFCRITLSSEPNTEIESVNIVQIKRGLQIIKEQQSTPQ